MKCEKLDFAKFCLAIILQVLLSFPLYFIMFTDLFLVWLLSIPIGLVATWYTCSLSNRFLIKNFNNAMEGLIQLILVLLPIFLVTIFKLFYF